MNESDPESRIKDILQISRAQMLLMGFEPATYKTIVTGRIRNERIFGSSPMILPYCIRIALTRKGIYATEQEKFGG